MQLLDFFCPLYQCTILCPWKVTEIALESEVTMDFCAKENIHRNKLLIIDHQVKVTYEMIKFSVIDLVIR